MLCVYQCGNVQIQLRKVVFVDGKLPAKLLIEVWSLQNKKRSLTATDLK